MEYRIAAESEYPALCRLWQQVFGDSEAFAEQVFRQFAGPRGVYTAVENGEPVSLLCAVPVTMQSKAGAYFYGLATRPDHRGKGLMHGLIEHVCGLLTQQGCQFVCLIPAGPSLFDFYAQQKFEKAFALRSFTKPIRRNLWAQAEFDNVTAKALMELRQQYAPNSVQLNLQGMTMVLMGLYSAGATIVNSSEGYGIYFVQDEDTLRFTELFAKNDEAAQLLLEAAREKERSAQAQITLGAGQELFQGMGQNQDYGMIRFLAQPFDVQESYMRLMLDDE